MPHVRYEMRFTGRVQGVGFRATTQSIARNFDVTGWVRNEPDGSVKCLVEGEPAEVARFIEKVKSAMHGCIHDTNVEKSAATGEFKAFRVAH